MVLDGGGPVGGVGVEGVEEGFLDPSSNCQLRLIRLNGMPGIQEPLFPPAVPPQAVRQQQHLRRNRKGEGQRQEQSERGAATYFATWPSRSRTVFICDRRSGSSVAGV